MVLVNYKNTEFNICNFQGRSFYPYMYVIIRLEDKPKTELPDCNKCGDYEYCAFQYDKCTGFIPGPESYE